MNELNLARFVPVDHIGNPIERLAILFDLHYDRLYRLARRLTASADDALDLVQETFLKAARNARSIPIGSSNEEAWLVRVLINIRRDQWRKNLIRRRFAAASSEKSLSAPAHDDVEARLIARTSVWRALDVLSPRRRAIVVMHELDEMAVPAIASLLGISQITVRWHLSMGRRDLTTFINIVTSFGSDNGDVVFTVGDPTPNILNVSPSVWQAGTASLPITITGSGFGDSPTVAVLGSGVTLLSTGSTSDTQISATVSIASGAPTGPATVQVQSNGYCGTGFQPANDNSSTATYGVSVQATPAPAPTIQLYGTTIDLNQPVSVVVGQQIALSATVSGVTVSSQSWSTPDGTVVGGYTNASGALPSCSTAQSFPPPDTTGGRVLGLPPQNDSCFTFYWVDLTDANQYPVTYTYTASNGNSASATVTFEVDAPSGVNVGSPTEGSPIQAAANVAPISGSANGITQLSDGIEALASATSLPTGGQYQWVQLIDGSTIKGVTPLSPAQQSCTPVSSSNPELDNTYPYLLVSTTTVTDDTVNDSPTFPLKPANGEIASTFSASMYLMWVPPALTGTYVCPSGNACTIPVPLGYFPWNWWGDAINTLELNPNNTSFPLWVANDLSPSVNPTFAEDNSLPGWSITLKNSGNPTVCQFLY